MQSCSSEKKKKKSKPLKIYIFGPNLLRKEEVYISDTQNKKKKNTEIHLSDKFSKPFNFIKTSNVLTELWLFFHSVWRFLPKKGHFQQMQLSSQNSIRPVNAMLLKRLQTTLHMKNSMQCCPKGSRQHGTQKIQAMLSEQHLVFPFTYIIY